MQYTIVCAYCGKEHITFQQKTKYCSKLCKDRARHNIEPKEKQCIICGKPFIAYDERRVTCSVECSEIRERNGKRYGKERILYNKICPICNTEFETGNPTQVTCLNDFCKKENKRIKQKERNMKNNGYRKPTPLNKKECAYCGLEFYVRGNSKQTCCSETCRRKRDNLKKEKRIPKEQIIDIVPLKRLYKRDNGICYICGCKCNFDDWSISKKGNEYPGDTYPTKEHVTPISKGGLESWDNVRLACFKCNREKADGVIKIKPMSKEFAYSQKYTSSAKQTAQYSLGGQLIKIWQSTAQIERELGLKSKRIQNACRRDKSNTGNAYGFHWEYVS